MQNPGAPLSKLADAAALLAAAAWAGGLWGIGYMAVPVLFQTLQDKMLAGMLAGKMFSVIAYAGIACAAYLLAHQISRSGRNAFRKPALWLILSMLLLTLIIQFGIQPAMADLKAQVAPADIMHSDLSGRFKMLHGLSSILYLAESLLGAMLILKVKNS